jgi:hypothetical protein
MAGNWNREKRGAEDRIDDESSVFIPLAIDWRTAKIQHARIVCRDLILARYSEHDQINAAIDGKKDELKRIAAWRDKCRDAYSACVAIIQETEHPEMFSVANWTGWPSEVSLDHA